MMRTQVPDSIPLETYVSDNQLVHHAATYEAVTSGTQAKVSLYRNGVRVAQYTKGSPMQTQASAGVI